MTTDSRLPHLVGWPEKFISWLEMTQGTVRWDSLNHRDQDIVKIELCYIKARQGQNVAEWFRERTFEFKFDVRGAGVDPVHGVLRHIVIEKKR